MAPKSERFGIAPGFFAIVPPKLSHFDRTGRTLINRKEMSGEADQVSLAVRKLPTLILFFLLSRMSEWSAPLNDPDKYNNYCDNKEDMNKSANRVTAH
jgi:hypothetical protein